MIREKELFEIYLKSDEYKQTVKDCYFKPDSEFEITDEFLKGFTPELRDNEHTLKAYDKQIDMLNEMAKQVMEILRK